MKHGSTKTAPRLSAKSGGLSRSFRCAGGFLLVWYCGFFSPVGLWLAVLLGSLDPAHQLQFHANEHGQQLVLHHGAACCQHHHGLIAQTLTFFAEPTDPNDPDHVIQFSAANGLLQSAKSDAPNSPAGATPVFFLTHNLHEPSLAAKSAVFHSHSPPGDGGRSRMLRTTVLLI